jgi:hypothetical protein
MVITQITAVVENYSVGWEDKPVPNTEATIYGIGEDQKMYFWARTKTVKTEHEPDEEGETSHYEHEWGWKLYQP